MQALKAFAPYGVAAVAQVLERSQAAVRAQARTLGVWLPSTTCDDPLTVEARRILGCAEAAARLPLCPVCGVRPATHRPEGMCRVCWLDRCIAACDEEAIVPVQRRQLAAGRQRKHRRRVCKVCNATWSPRTATCTDRCPKCR